MVFQQKRNVYEQSKRKAFFDIDGTIRSGAIIYDFAEFLRNNDLFSREIYENMEKMFRRYDDEVIEYEALTLGVQSNYGQGLKGQQRERIEELARIYFSSSEHHKLLPYSKELVENISGFRSNVALSASPVEAVYAFIKATKLPFDHIIASEPECSGGIYTGRMKTSFDTGESKRRAVDAYLKEQKCNRDGLFGCGDSGHDIPFLEQLTFRALVLRDIHEPKKAKFVEELEKKGWLKYAIEPNERQIHDICYILKHHDEPDIKINTTIDGVEYIISIKHKKDTPLRADVEICREKRKVGRIGRLYLGGVQSNFTECIRKGLKNLEGYDAIAEAIWSYRYRPIYHYENKPSSDSLDKGDSPKKSVIIRPYTGTL